jgi:hypothetical protein
MSDNLQTAETFDAIRDLGVRSLLERPGPIYPKHGHPDEAASIKVETISNGSRI